MTRERNYIMNQNEIIAILDELRSGTINEYRVPKEHFLSFRAIWVTQKDKKHFRGRALQGGDVVYTYEPNWTA